ncbi:MAG: DUF4349 domain-containing protein [Coriobacteriia bacterium]|nr:DUF4349 domain-containing protein [Coriobacteriia bacterium]
MRNSQKTEKKNKGLASLLSTVLVLALLLSGCSRASNKQEASTGANSSNSSVNSNQYYSESDDALGYDYDRYGDGGGYGVYESNSGALNTAATTGSEITRKEIKNGSISLSVEDVDEAYAALLEIIDKTGGYVYSKNENRRDGELFVTLTAKIPPQSLSWFEQELTAVLGSEAIVQYEISSNDITSSYYDMASRLDSSRKTLARYEELLSEAKNVQDMLDIQREISRVQADIDSMEGQIRMWDQLVGYATLDIHITSPRAPIAVTTWKFNSGSEVADKMVEGFVSVLSVLINGFLWALVLLVSYSPILLPVALIVMFIWFRQRNKKRQLATESVSLAETSQGQSTAVSSSGYHSGLTSSGLNGEQPTPPQSEQRLDQ